MTTKKTKDENKEINHEETSEVQEVTTKTCFIIMPIADVPSYESGHFNRVYQHLIAPACRKAGFKPIRADEVNSSNMIVLDILKKIVECDMAVCDLSSRNPNVLYELGLRQAFNKKTVLIKDRITTSPFDVQAFRYAEYDSSLRVDNVQNEITSLAASIKSTYEAQDDVNSIVQLLQIEPAKIGEKTQLNTSDTIILSAIKNLTNRVDNLHSYNEKTSKTLNLYNNENVNRTKSLFRKTPNISLDDKVIATDTLSELLNHYAPELIVNSFIFYTDSKELGMLDDFDTRSGYMTFQNGNGKSYRYPLEQKYLDSIYGHKISDM